MLVTRPEPTQIRQFYLAALICDSSDDIRAVPLDTLKFIHEETNPLVDCDDVPRVACLWGTKYSHLLNTSQGRDNSPGWVKVENQGLNKSQGWEEEETKGRIITKGG